MECEVDDSSEDTLNSESHSCSHCQVPLRLPSRLPLPLSKIVFPQTISKVKKASLNACPLFKHLFSHYTRRSVWQIFSTHWFRRCDWCNNTFQAFQHILRSLSYTPFQLVLVAEPYQTRLGNTFISRAYFDCADGKNGFGFNCEHLFW